MLLLAASLLLACEMGPSAETLVDELRVVVLVPESPEIQPGEITPVEGVVADPEGLGFDRITWTCTRLGPDCLEASDSDSAWVGLQVESDAEPGVFEGVAAAAPPLAAAASDEPLPLVQIFTLVCPPGACGVIDRALSDPEPGSAEAERLAEELTDPFDTLEDLPLAGTSLASWSLDVSTRSVEERRQHPTLGPCVLNADGSTETDTEAKPGAELNATCDLSGRFDADAALWGYATAGGWESPAASFEDDIEQVDGYTWFAPDAEDAPDAPVELWLVLTDGIGGLAWTSFSVSVTD